MAKVFVSINENSISKDILQVFRNYGNGEPLEDLFVDIKADLVESPKFQEFIHNVCLDVSICGDNGEELVNKIPLIDFARCR